MHYQLLSLVRKTGIATAAGAGILCIQLSAAGVANAAAFPGPDTFGYSGTMIPFNLRDVSGTGANIGLDNSDDDTAVVSIGFTFSFYGANYTEIEVSTNGFGSFSQTGNAGCCSGDPIPTAGRIDNFIASFWQDHDPSEGGTIRTETSGAAGSREFVLGFYDVKDFDDPDNVEGTWEMILHETSNDIELQYVAGTAHPGMHASNSTISTTRLSGSRISMDRMVSRSCFSIAVIRISATATPSLKGRGSASAQAAPTVASRPFPSLPRSACSASALPASLSPGGAAPHSLRK